MERNHLADFTGSHQIRGTQHRNRIRRLEIRELLRQAQPIAIDTII